MPKFLLVAMSVHLIVAKVGSQVVFDIPEDT
jgi:hypothetical protein